MTVASFFKPRIRLDPKYNLWKYKGKHYASLEMICKKIPSPEISWALEKMRAELRQQAHFDCMLANASDVTQLRYASQLNRFPSNRSGLFGGSEYFGIKY